MMNIVESVGRTTKNVLLLGLLCLVVEQAIYCVLIPGYFFSMMVSPVFWGSISVSCFSALYWLNKKHFCVDEASEYDEGQDVYHPIFDNPVNPMNPSYTRRPTFH